MNKLKKLLSCLLAAALLFSCVFASDGVMTAFADELSESVSDSQSYVQMQESEDEANDPADSTSDSDLIDSEAPSDDTPAVTVDEETEEVLEEEASDDDIMTAANDLNTAYKQLVTFSGQGTTRSASYTLTVATGNTWQLICSVDDAEWSIFSNTTPSVASAYVSGDNIIIEALSEGSTTVTVTAAVGNTTYTITATLTVNNSFDLKSTFKSYRYYHLDLKVVADFTIYVYDSNTDSIRAMKPTDTEVTGVAAKIYNTSANSESPTCNAYAGTWSQTTSMSNYNESDTYNNMTVTSYDVNWNEDVTVDENNGTYEYQSVGGHSGATSSAAALCYYDGDTVVLTVTIQYTYNGHTYTQDLEVTYTVCEHYNICSSASDTNDTRGFDINVAALDVNEIAATRIQKVDQYGDPVTGAVFALYTTSQDGNYYYLIDGKSETIIYADLSSATYSVDAATGVISDIEGATYYTYSGNGTATEYSGSVKDAKISPCLTESTDSDGYFTFVYPNDYSQEELRGVSMTMSDLKAVYGEYFILREIDAPNGYLIVSEAMQMHLSGTGTTLLLECENNIESGVTTEPVIMVMATKDYLVKADPVGEYADDADGNNWVEQEGHKIEYIEKDDNGSESINGTLFVSILKKGDRNPENDTIDTWYPVYGNDEEGYTILNYEDWCQGNSENLYVKQLSAAIYAAQQQLDLNGESTEGILFNLGDSGNVTLTISSLPGSVKEYYNYIQKINAADENTTNDSIEALRAESEYFAGYYYTTADSLENATTENTWRVMSRSGLTEDYGGFTIVWGSNINVTDYRNVIYFQKVDSDRNLVNDAVFALYKVGEDSGGKLYYIADDEETAVYLEADADGDNKGTAKVGDTSGTYSISATGEYTTDSSGNVTNSGYGVITVMIDKSEYTLTPTQVGKTETMAGENGTGSFTNLSEGCYVMREIFAPDPFVLNTTEVKIYVDSSGIYADAGEADDGVIVGCDPGYLSESFSGFASEGEINQTLSYIYTTLMINNSGTFEELVESLDTGWGFVAQGSETAGAGEAVESLSKAIVTYLEYSYSGENTLFNYKANSNQNARTAAGSAGINTLSGQNSRRLWTDENWAKLAIYQDYAYGKDNAGNATYEDLTSYGDISHLFAPAAYIRVTDEVKLNLDITKIDASDETTLEGAEFYLYYEVTGDGGSVTARYYYANSGSNGGSTAWVEATAESDGTYTVPSTATKLSPGTEAAHVYGLSSTVGTYYLEEVTAPSGYDLLSSPVTITVSGAQITAAYGETTYSTSSESDGNGWNVTKNEAGEGETDSYTFTLTVPNSTYTQLTVTKEWDDSSNQDGIRPGSITVTVYADGETTNNTATITPNDNGSWTYTFENLAIYNSSGQAITYSVVETNIDYYETTYSDVSGSASEGYTVTVTNTHTPETISISGTKTWDDADDQDGKRPSEITVNLYTDGKLVESKTVTASDNWAYSFENLPKYKDGVEITYTITETTVEDYTTTYNGYDITNSYTPGKTSVTVTKAWDDADNQDGVRPESVTVELLANGEETGQTLTLSADNNWTGSFTELNEYASGEKIEYTIKEFDVEGYTPVIAGDAASGFVVTNTKTVKPNGGSSPSIQTRTNVSVSKVWVLDDGGTAAQSVTVNLYGNGVYVKSAVLSAANGWSYTWYGLDSTILWLVEEASVPIGFTSSVSYNGNNVFVITNDDIPTEGEVEEIEEAVEPGDVDEEDDTVEVPAESNAEEASNPKTGAAFAMLPALVAAVFAVGSKRR